MHNGNYSKCQTSDYGDVATTGVVGCGFDSINILTGTLNFHFFSTMYQFISETE